MPPRALIPVAAILVALSTLIEGWNFSTMAENWKLSPAVVWLAFFGSVAPMVMVSCRRVERTVSTLSAMLAKLMASDDASTWQAGGAAAQPAAMAAPLSPCSQARR